MKQDHAFHRALWEIADHAILIKVVSSPRVRLRRFLYEDARAFSHDQAHRHVGSHDELIDILKSGDFVAAQAEIHSTSWQTRNGF